MGTAASTPVDVAEGQDTTGIEVPIKITDIPANRPTLHGVVLNSDGTPAVLAALNLRSNDKERRDDAIFSGLDGSFRNSRHRGIWQPDALGLQRRSQRRGQCGFQ